MGLVEAVCSRISYDPDTGELRWKRRDPSSFSPGKYPSERLAAIFNSAYAGKLALNTDNGKGYRVGGFDGRGLKAHHAAWMIHYNEPPPEQIDHINGDRADNRIANLRAASSVVNGRNKKLDRRNKSGCPGVWERPSGKWAAAIGSSRDERIYLGQFSTRDEAIAAKRGAERARGYHPNHGRREI